MAFKQKGMATLGLVLAMGAGAGIMYLADPRQGRRRRARLMDKSAHWVKRAGTLSLRSGRDFAHRVRGTLTEFRTSLRKVETPDEVLVERVRARLGHAGRVPRALEIRAAQGRVSLIGAVNARDAAAILRCVSSVPGVVHVDNHLSVHGGVPRPLEARFGT